MLGTLGRLILLNVVDPSLGRRLGFLIGPVLALFFLGFRYNAIFPTMLFYGYPPTVGVMIVGGVVEIFLGIDAENKALEDVAAPLSFAGDSRS